MTTLTAGKKAPKFKLNDQDGKERTLDEFKGKKLVIYFYPKDDTPTCTVEACNLRDNYKKLLKEGYSVLGVSMDTEKKHRNFINKYKLPFDLLSDPEQKMISDYGVWGEKTLFGRDYMGILRTTFVIDEKGKIAEVISKVESKNHAAQILPAKEKSARS